MKKYNELDTMSIRNATTIFGIRRKAGTTIYDEENQKMYFLTAPAMANASLTSTLNKTEI